MSAIWQTLAFIVRRIRQDYRYGWSGGWSSLMLGGVVGEAGGSVFRRLYMVFGCMGFLGLGLLFFRFCIA